LIASQPEREAVSWEERQAMIDSASTMSQAAAQTGLSDGGVRWLCRAAFDGEELRRLWTLRPQADARLPAGRAFDVVDSDASTWEEVRFRLALRGLLSPCFFDHGRVRWLITPADPRRLDVAADEVLWPRGVALPLWCGFGDYVTVPGRRPSPGGSRYWLSAPAFDPQPMASMTAMLATLAEIVLDTPPATA
jgi:hypothetical protein